MLLRTCGISVLPASLLCVAVMAAEESWPLTEDWEIRYETHRNFVPADLAAGKTPAFRVHVDDEKGTPVLAIDGDNQGGLSGYIYVGRRIQLPKKLPGGARVRLEFQRECTENNRAPGLTLYLFTTAGWDGLARSPGASKFHAAWPRNALLRSATIVSGREDTLRWTPWESPELTPVLRRARGRDFVVALCMAAMHTGATEWARFRAPRLVISDEKPMRARQKPRYPPKTRRTLLDDAEVALARRRCSEDASAAGIRDGLERRCRFWMDMADVEIRLRIPPADVPRAFNVSTRGCPVHGKAIYKHGTYPWRLDPKHPFKITCPVGGEQFPSNDYFAYLRSGFKDASLLEGAGKHVDDGWGWTAPDGEQYWLVGYACHWYWSRTVLPGVLNLSRAYLLTGKPEIAHKCAVMLDRIADVYPAMEYETQSRYGYETGGRYLGKILNHIWETGTLRKLAEAYDNIFDALRDGGPLEGKLRRSCRETRSNIEANLLEEGIDCVHDGHIRGNFGMHQCALAMAAVVRETDPVQEELDRILQGSGDRLDDAGIGYAFYNFIYKDGMPFETSPGYCFSWVSNFVSLARVLKKTGYDFYTNPRFKAMLSVFLDMVCIGRYTPAIGDASSPTGGRVGGSAPVYREAFAHYRDPRFAHALDTFGALRKPGFKTYASLFEQDVFAEAAKVAKETVVPPPRSRILDGYGLGILNNPRNTMAVSIYYGFHGGHGHFDRLNFSLFAYGGKMTPDLGYPDFMNALVSGIYTWSKNTVSHNCVVVNRRRQLGNVPGKVLAFLDAPDVHFIDISAEGTYPVASVYRRSLVLVDTGPDAGYLLDFSTVTGGNQHDYSLHGPIGTFNLTGGTLSKPQTKGTLAGESVGYGELYDDAVLGASGYHGGYGGYTGSGFQHLEHVQTLAESKAGWWANWKLDGMDDVGLRIRILDQPGQQVLVCDGRVSPTGKHPWVLKYLIARRRGKDLRSRYIALLEPFRKQSEIVNVKRFDFDGGAGVRVERRTGVDVILLQTAESPRDIEVGGVATRAKLCVVRFTSAGKVDSVAMLGGAYAQIGKRKVTGAPGYAGKVTAVDYKRRTVRVRFADGAMPTPAALAALRGRRVFFSNPRHSCVYTVREARSDGAEMIIALMEPEIMTGRARITGIDAKKRVIRTPSRFAFPAVYPGMRAVNEAHSVSLRVKTVARGQVQLEDTLAPKTFSDADHDGVADAWLCDFGPGDDFRIDSVTVWTAQPE